MQGEMKVEMEPKQNFVFFNLAMLLLLLSSEIRWKGAPVKIHNFKGWCRIIFRIESDLLASHSSFVKKRWIFTSCFLAARFNPVKTYMEPKQNLSFFNIICFNGIFSGNCCLVNKSKILHNKRNILQKITGHLVEILNL